MSQIYTYINYWQNPLFMRVYSKAPILHFWSVTLQVPAFLPTPPATWDIDSEAIKIKLVCFYQQLLNAIIITHQFDK